MTSKTIREFLIERGQNPDEFTRVLDKNEGAASYDWDCYGTKATDYVMDIKRFGELVVVLVRRIYYRGYPGIRRVTLVEVYSDTKEIVCGAEDVFIDGGYQTHHLDRPKRDFEEIVAAEWTNSRILVRVKSKHAEDDLWCHPIGRKKSS